MSQVDHIDKIAFSTAFEIDKVLETYTGSFAVGGSSTATDVISHSFGEHVLPIMVWSSDNSTWIDAGSADFTGGVTPTVVMSATCSTDANDITVTATNGTGSSKTCYYKVALIVED